MNNSEKNYGVEDADNSPNKNTTGIQSPSNDSFQQSLYIAALAFSLGLTGLVSPVTDDRDGIHYEFDFYQSASGELIKVLQTLDQKEWKKYRTHPSEPMILVDGHSTGFEFKKCPCCPEEYLDGGYDVAEAIHHYPNAFVFYDDDLWAPFDHDDLGKVWSVVTPYAIRVVLNKDDDSDDDESEE